ncbi:MAG: hypothetical protein AAGB32_05380 [Pseudomonadota bacterium]
MGYIIPSGWDNRVSKAIEESDITLELSGFDAETMSQLSQAIPLKWEATLYGFEIPVSKKRRSTPYSADFLYHQSSTRFNGSTLSLTLYRAANSLTWQETVDACPDIIEALSGIRLEMHGELARVYNFPHKLPGTLPPPEGKEETLFEMVERTGDSISGTIRLTPANSEGPQGGTAP